MSKVIIVGGLGFIFSHVTEYFVKKGYDVVVIDNESVGSHPDIVNGSFKYYKTHAGNPEAYTAIVQENPDYIIHAAAYSDVDFSLNCPKEVMESNNAATINVFEAARRCPNLKKLVYISTDEVYGECEHRKVEDEIIFPKNPYSCSKAFGSLVRLTYDNSFPELKDKTAETRFCNVYGDRQDTRKIMPLIKKALQTGESIPLHNEGTGFREYIHVSNIPPAVELVMLKGDRVYNVTLNDGLTVHQLIQKAEEVTGKTIKTHATNRPGMDLKYQMDNTRIKELGWVPTTTFEEGLKQYLC
jgi:nucleoside-diphosphate-sugar epimerase